MVLESPKGINQSLNQPSTSYRAKGEKEKNPQKDDNHVVNSSSTDSLHHVIRRKVFRKRKKKDKLEKLSSSKALPKNNQALIDELKNKTNA